MFERVRAWLRGDRAVPAPDRWVSCGEAASIIGVRQEIDKYRAAILSGGFVTVKKTTDYETTPWL